MVKVPNTLGLELKVPPVALVLIIAALMWLGAWSVPRLTFPVPGRHFIAGGVALAGALVSILGVVSFKLAKTTVNPMKPESTSSLVIAGIYRATRNPMYLAFLLILLGWAVYLSNVLAFLPIPGFVIYMHVFQIRPEERTLELPLRPGVRYVQGPCAQADPVKPCLIRLALPCPRCG
jgi:protein-S-isoprenylcysteine O-methyltransferase Ste14